jgi:hypothetical protein
MKILLLLLAISVCAFAQVEFRYEKELSLTAQVGTWTVQQPATANETASFSGSPALGITIYCSVACKVTLERDGAAESATDDSATIRPVSPHQSNARSTLKAYSSVNGGAGAGTVIKTYNLAAGEEKVIPEPSLTLGTAADQNIKVRTDSITGTARAYFQWVRKS